MSLLFFSVAFQTPFKPSIIIQCVITWIDLIMSVLVVLILLTLLSDLCMQCRQMELAELLKIIVFVSSRKVMWNVPQGLL